MSGPTQKAPRQRCEPARAEDVRSDVLQVFGAGLIVEGHAPYMLWRDVEAAAGQRIAAPKRAGTLDNALARARLFRAEALRATLQHWSADGRAVQSFVENYPLPAQFVFPGYGDGMKDPQAWMKRRAVRMQQVLQLDAGMGFHAFEAGPAMRLQTINDLLWTTIFERFDGAGDLSSLLVYAEEGHAVRSELGWTEDAGEDLRDVLARDRRGTDRSDTFAPLLLGRPEAAQWLRELAPHVVDSVDVVTHANGLRSRSAHGFGHLGRDHHTGRVTYRAPARAARTPYVPEPWSEAQIAQYNAMPMLAGVHRPMMATWEDPRAADAVKALAAALAAAIDGPLQGVPPLRVFYDLGALGDEAARRVLLLQSLQAAMPAFDLLDVRHGYSLVDRLGDTGAAGAFAGVGLASLAAWETGDAALVVLLRRTQGATVLAVSPADAAYRQRFKKMPYAAS